MFRSRRRSAGVAVRMASRDLEQVALLAELQRTAGGNAAEVLDTVVETLRERADLRRLVQTLTAQGRLARWILSALPIAGRARSRGDSADGDPSRWSRAASARSASWSRRCSWSRGHSSSRRSSTSRSRSHHDRSSALRTHARRSLRGAWPCAPSPPHARSAAATPSRRSRATGSRDPSARRRPAIGARTRWHSTRSPRRSERSRVRRFASMRRAGDAQAAASARAATGRRPRRSSATGCSRQADRRSLVAAVARLAAAVSPRGLLIAVLRRGARLDPALVLPCKRQGTTRLQRDRPRDAGARRPARDDGGGRRRLRGRAAARRAPGRGPARATSSGSRSRSRAWA